MHKLWHNTTINHRENFRVVPIVFFVALLIELQSQYNFQLTTCTNKDSIQCTSYQDDMQQSKSMHKLWYDTTINHPFCRAVPCRVVVLLSKRCHHNRIKYTTNQLPLLGVVSRLLFDLVERGFDKCTSDDNMQQSKCERRYQYDICQYNNQPGWMIR